MTTAPRTLVVAHPSAELYGSDRQLLETVAAAHEAGWRVLLALPQDGPLVAEAQQAGAQVRVLDFPVLRKAELRPRRALRLVARAAAAILGARRLLRRLGPDLLYVNTVTIPWWVAAGRLAGVPVLCHVHEAEDSAPRPVRVGMNAPMLLADAVLANSAAAADVLTEAVPALAGRVQVVHNGVPGPADPRPTAPHAGPYRLALVGRLSPRKGTDVALAATALLLAQGLDVHLDVVGSTFTGYEWYEQRLRDRAASPDLSGHVHLRGFVSPTWDVLAAADVVLVPSRAEPFGNVAVEAMLARRPVVASAVQGLREVVDDGRTGLLVPPDDPTALARAVGALLTDPDRAAELARAGFDEATRRFTTGVYRAQVARALDSAVARRA